MGKLFENEVELRKHAKEVKALILESHDIDKALELISNNEEILTYNYGRNKYLSLLPTVRSEKGLKNKYEYLEKIIQVGFQIYERSKNYDELVFFAAASCDVECLCLCLKKIPNENHNKTKEGDTIVLFFVKYANLENVKYLDALLILVNECKLDLNKGDYQNHSPIIILLNKYVNLNVKKIMKYNTVIVNASSILLTRNNIDLVSHKIDGTNALDIIETFHLKDILQTLKRENSLNCRSQSRSEIEDTRSILFSLLSQGEEHEFLQNINEIVDRENNFFDIEDGNNTLLQLACEKKLEKVVCYLIEQGADLAKTTKRNRKPPLEIVARRNYLTIFKHLLKANKIIIDSKLFTIFLLNRGRQIKTKYFDEILCYDGLQVDIVYENGNTPLHYAIFFSNTEAILKLLKRGASLLTKNKSGKDPLDYISKEDLELYLDQCILVDKHNKPYSKKYEVRLDFNGFVEKETNKDTVVSELEVLSKVCSSERLRPLTKHPLILAFIEIKWTLVSSFYKKIMLMYSFFFIYSLIISSYIGHITFLYLFIASVLILCTVQPAMVSKVISAKDASIILAYIVFTFVVYFQFQNSNISISLLMISLFYQFLKQHLYFSKYQASVVNCFRKITPYIITLFALHYYNDFENNLKYSKLNIIIFLVITYILLITYSFNALADSIGDIEYSLKTVYNKDTVQFLTFSENLYRNFNSLLNNPFVYKYIESFSNKEHSKLYFSYYLSKNKFVNEKFHFLKLDGLTVKRLQDFVNKFNENGKHE